MHYHLIPILPDILFPLAALLFMPALWWFSYCFDHREYGASDDEKLYELSKFRNCSEYDIFCAAAANWHLGRGRIEHDFTAYLFSGGLPYYVRSFLRNIPTRPAGPKAVDVS